MDTRTSLVIVPVDGSPASIAAARHAGHLARWLNVPMHLLHVKPLNPAELSDIPANRLHEVDHDHNVLQKATEQAFAKARSVLDSAVLETLREVTLQDEGFVKDPAGPIVDYASQRPGCMIVMGARGLGELGRFFLGSVSNAVIHKALCPVTVVHDDTLLGEGSTLERILLPVDGSPHSDAAAVLAGELSRAVKAPVDLLFCHPANPASDHARAQLESESQNARQVFAQARHRLGEPSPVIGEHHIVTGYPADGIIAYVRRQAGPIILIMGRRGMSQWQDRLLGSVSHKVIDEAPCPVTVVT